jgi:hypothetical protein
MARFLSGRWLEEAEAAGPEPGADVELVLQQVVTGTPDGDICYQVLITGSGATLRRGASLKPDMTFTSDYATASAIAQGRLSVQSALTEGLIRVGGNTSRLARKDARLAGVDPLPPALRESTSYETDG